MTKPRKTTAVELAEALAEGREAPTVHALVRLYYQLSACRETLARGKAVVALARLSDAAPAVSREDLAALLPLVVEAAKPPKHHREALASATVNGATGTTLLRAQAHKIMMSSKQQPVAPLQSKSAEAPAVGIATVGKRGVSADAVFPELAAPLPPREALAFAAQLAKWARAKGATLHRRGHRDPHATHCRKGHALTPTNTFRQTVRGYVYRGCRTCKYASNKLSDARRAGVASRKVAK